MTRSNVPYRMMAAAFGLAAALAVLVLSIHGTGEKAVRTALDVTARWSFLLFWLAYSARALAVLWPAPFASLSRKGRDFGLAFAAAHLVHVGLIIWLGLILGRVPLQGGLLVFFAVALFFTYLMALLSFGLAQQSGLRLWRGLLPVGMNYILIAFARDFVLGAIKAESLHREAWRTVDYAFFAGLCILAPLLRIGAALRRRWETQPVSVA